MNLCAPQDKDGEKEDKEEEKKEEQSEETRKRKSALPAFDIVSWPAAGDARIPIALLGTRYMCFTLCHPLVTTCS